MIIKLTNAVKEHDNKPILINTDHIVSIFPDNIIEGKVITAISTIYSITKESWYVKETPEQIYEQILELT